MNNIQKMDPILYLTILAGLLTVILSIITYSKGKRKEIEADLVNKQLMERTVEVADLQNKLLIEMGKTGEKSDLIVKLQNELNQASAQILRLSNENTKQILGIGTPTLTLHVFPDKLISLHIVNDNDYPIYDVALSFPDPDTAKTLKERMQSTSDNMSWDLMRKQWIFVDAFNLPKKSGKYFYQFTLSESIDRTSVFINIVTRHGTFNGLIATKRDNESFSFLAEVRDSNGKLLTENKNNWK